MEISTFVLRCNYQVFGEALDWVAKKQGKADYCHLKEGETIKAVNFLHLIFGLSKVTLFTALLKVIIVNLSSSGT